MKEHISSLGRSKDSYAIQSRYLNYGGTGLDTEIQPKFLDLKKCL